MPEKLAPFFSIIIPTYNRGSFLPKTLESILEQEYSSFEILVVDDGSTDNTKEVVAGYSKLYSKIKYFYIPNSERGAARNYGIKKASGNYVFIIDSDDIMLPNHLMVLNRYINKYPDKNFFATKFSFFKEGREYSTPARKLREGDYDYKLFLKGNCLGTLICAKRANPELILYLEDRKYAVMEDWIFNIQNTFKDTIYLIDERTIFMMDHEGRSMANNEDVIKKRLLATEFLIESGLFSVSENLTIQKYSSYFCSIHSYLDKDWKRASFFLLEALRNRMWSLDLLKLSAKILFLIMKGKKSVQIQQD